MKLADLWSRYPYKDLVCAGDDPMQLYEVMKPLLENLHDQYIIYREKGLSLVKLSEIDLTEKRFGATAKVESMILQFSFVYPEEWEFGCTWEWYHLSGSWLAASPYVGYRVMVDADVVAKVKWCVQKGDLEQALALITEREKEGETQQESVRVEPCG